MDALALTPSQYLRAADFGVSLPKNPTYTITRTGLEEMFAFKQSGGDDESVVDKGVIRFQEVKQGWVANKTNVACLAAMFGKETSGWVGKRVTLCIERDNISKQDAIRVLGSPDIASAVKATIKLPRKRPIERILKPTGQAQGRAQAPADPLPGFLGACTEKLGLKAADVQAWADAERIPLATLDHAALIGLFTDLKPGGAKRASMDAFVAGPPANPPAGDGYGDDPPPGGGRSYGDEGVV